MYMNWFLTFSRVKRHQPRWQFPEKHYALWEIRERRIPQPDWDFRTRPIIKEIYRPNTSQPDTLPRIRMYEAMLPKRGGYS